MARVGSAAVWRRWHVLFQRGTAAGLPEGALVERFVTHRDPAAFEAIVARHGPMVWHVCRQALPDPNDAEDAFQATFLAFALKAGSVRDPGRLGPWLHRVACRVARRARRDPRRSEGLRDEPASPDPAPDGEAEARERAHLLHEAIARLPAKYRNPVVLCHLQGCTHDEAAARLGWPVGTVRGRLSRGRDRLRESLSRGGLAGVALPGGFDPVGPGPGPLGGSLTEIAVRVAAGEALGLVAPGRVATWVEGMGWVMLMKKAKTGLIGLTLGVVATAFGAGALAWAQSRDRPAGPPQAAKATQLPGVANESVKAAPAPLVFDPTEAPSEEAARELARLEADIELMTMDADLIKSAIEATLREVPDMERRSREVARMTSKSAPEQKKAAEELLQQTQKDGDEYRRHADESRTDFIRLREEVGRRKARLAQRRRELGMVASPSAPGPETERRLAAIEDAVNAIRKALESRGKVER